jgi:hypothetical protein
VNAMPKKKQSKKNKNKNNKEQSIEDANLIEANFNPSDYEYPEEESNYSCQDISPEHCEELRHRKFTNEKKDIFLEVRSLEERYKFLISEARANNDAEIKKVRVHNSTMYRSALKNKEKELYFEISELKEEIEKNLNSLEVQERMILSEIDMIYKVNKAKLVDQALDILGLSF